MAPSSVSPLRPSEPTVSAYAPPSQPVITSQPLGLRPAFLLPGETRGSASVITVQPPASSSDFSRPSRALSAAASSQARIYTVQPAPWEIFGEYQQPEFRRPVSRQPESTQPESRLSKSRETEPLRPESIYAEFRQPESRLSDSITPQFRQYRQTETSSPEFRHPVSRQSEPGLTETRMPESRQQHSRQLESRQPESRQSEPTQPETIKLGSKQPESRQADSRQQKFRLPEPTKPESIQLKSRSPESGQPDSRQQVFKEPESTKLASKQIEPTKHESKQQEIMQSEAKQPEISLSKFRNSDFKQTEFIYAVEPNLRRANHFDDEWVTSTQSKSRKSVQRKVLLLSQQKDSTEKLTFEQERVEPEKEMADKTSPRRARDRSKSKDTRIFKEMKIPLKL
jgi:hypothetical protein